MILRELSDLSITQSMTSEEKKSSDELLEKVGGNPFHNHARDDETQPINMTASPSLSALAEMLNSKYKNKDTKQSMNGTKDIQTIHEEASITDLDPSETPNLIDLEGNDKFMQPIHKDHNIDSYQPDFITTPKVEPGYFQEQKEPINFGGFQPIPEEKEEHIDFVHSIEKTPSSVDNLTHDESSQNNSMSSNIMQSTTQTSASMENSPGKSDMVNNRKIDSSTFKSETTKKRRSIFSFLKKKNRNSITDLPAPSSMYHNAPDSNIIQYGDGISSDISFDKSKRKSSANKLFTSFKKNGLNNTNSSDNITHYSHNHGHSSKSKTSNARKLNTQADSSKNVKTRSPEKIKLRKDNALDQGPSIRKQNFERIFSCDHSFETQSQNIQEEDSNIVPDNKDESEYIPTITESFILPPLDFETNICNTGDMKLDSPVLSMSKFESGAILFPKSLDDNEVESIISLERNRSMKSNKRNSTHSHRRSLSEALSIHAQNEGMFVTDATSVILSKPDLSKSPTSSILRNSGRFETIDHDYNTVDHISDYCKSPDFKDISEPNIPLDIEINTKPDHLLVDEDEELMSDIMDFANIINFGNENFDQYSLPDRREAISIDSSVNDEMENDISSSEFKNSRDESVTRTLETQVSDDDFENEDFNKKDDTEKSLKMDHGLNAAGEILFKNPIGLSSYHTLTPDSAIQSSIFTALPESTQELHKVRVTFSSRVLLHETYHETIYDRKPDLATCNVLTPQLAQAIKAELNELKSEMEVHRDSVCYTHFY